MSLVKTGIKIEGDSRDAQRAFGRLEDDIKGTTRALRSFAGEAASITFGVLGAGTIEEGLSKVFDFATESLEGYIERNREAAEVVEGTRQVMSEMTDTFFDAAFGGQNLEVILGSVNMIMQELTGYTEDNRDAIQQAVRQGWARLLDVVPPIIQVFNGFAAVVDGVKLAFRGWEFGINAAIFVLGELGMSLVQGILPVFGDLASSARILMENLAAMAGAVPGMDGLASSLERAANRMGELGASADSAVERMQVSRERAREVMASQRDELMSDMRAFADRIVARNDFYENAVAAVDSYQDAIMDGTTAEHAFRRAVGSGNVEIENRVDSLRQLGAALMGYAERWMEFHEIYKSGIREKLDAEEEYHAFLMDRYTAQQDKILELAQERAAAEIGAQTKIEDAIMRTAEAYDMWAASSVDAFELAIAGQISYAEAARSSIGDVVAGLADEARARAIAAGATGNFGAAAALGAASVAIGAIAATLGASQGGGGRGGGEGAGPTQITNVDVRVIGGPMGVTQDQIRALSDAVQTGVDRGMVRA